MFGNAIRSTEVMESTEGISAVNGRKVALIHPHTEDKGWRRAGRHAQLFATSTCNIAKPSEQEAGNGSDRSCPRSSGRFSRSQGANMRLGRLLFWMVVWCQVGCTLGKTVDTGGPSPARDPTPQLPFDERSLVGLDGNDAAEIVGKHGWRCEQVAAYPAGEPAPLTGRNEASGVRDSAYRPPRCRLWVRDGKVVAACLVQDPD